MQTKPKYVFVVGNGDLAKSLIISAKNLEIDFIIAGIQGISDKSLVNMHDNFWFYLGQVENFLQQLKFYNVDKIIFVGAMTRPSLLSLKVDSLGREILKEHISNIKGDDSLFKLIINKLESRGFKVVGFQEIDDSLIKHEGLLTESFEINDFQEDINNGFNLAKSLSEFDIGQSLVFQQGMVIAVEAVEGTAKMILRSRRLLKKQGRKGILIKVKKHSQDIRIDLPTIGDKTIKQAKKAGLKGIVIEKKYTVILNYDKTIRLANRFGIFIVSI